MSILLPLGDRSFDVRTSNADAREALRTLVRPSTLPLPLRREPLDLDARLEEGATSGHVLATTMRLAARSLFPEHVLLHAAAVAGPRGAALFVGPSGAGKTTIAFVALRLGMDVLADDVTCVRVADRAVLPAPIRLRARAATRRLVSIRRPPSHAPPPAPLHSVFLLGAPRESTARLLGTEALVSELDGERRWEAACILGALLDHAVVRRLRRLRLDDEGGVRDARRRLRALFLRLGADPRRIGRVLGDDGLAFDRDAHRTA